MRLNYGHTMRAGYRFTIAERKSELIKTYFDINFNFTN